MTKRIREAAEKYALSKYGDDSWTAQSEKLGARDFRAGAEWMLAEVLREMRLNYINGGKGMADFIESRLKGKPDEKT